MAKHHKVPAALLSVMVLFDTAVVASPLPEASSYSVASQQRTSAEVATPEAQQAKNWGLKTEEWGRYRELMQGPLGIYSPNIDPLTALGIEARSDEERRHFAELQAQAEARRVEKILAYQRAYDEAWQRLNPGMQRVSLPGAQVPGADITGSGRLAVFIKPDCTACMQRVKQLQAAGTAFDLYMVGSQQDDVRIRQWATQAAIDPAKVRSRTITLNHDSGLWLSLGLAGELPAVVRQVNGQWQRQ